MRIRRNILASAILTMGTVGSLVAAPALALTAATPAATAVVSANVSPNAFTYHG